MNTKENTKTAFVFSGGASLGSIEVGALKAIVEEGIQADMVFGTSVGSLNGAMYAFNPTLDGVRKIEHIWRNIKMWDVFTPSPLTPVINLTTSGDHLISPKNLRKVITENLPFIMIEETKIPLYIIGTDIKCGEEVIFNRGLALEALMSSAGIPGVFPIQRMGERAIVDGGLINNSPISAAVRLGAKRVVVFPIGVPSTEQVPKNVMEILIRSFIYLLNRQLTTDIQLYKVKAEIIVVPPPESIDVGPHDFSKSDMLMRESYLVAKEWLKTEGFKSNADKYMNPCNAHNTARLNFVEAIVPEPETKATTRVKENIKETTKSIKETLDDKAVELKEKISKRLP
ncbi:MAG: patatin-like phospholipase family protein [Candidatus Thorarchaeota archaeon]